MKTTDYDLAVHLVATERRAGTSFLKQQLRLSESKVARLIKQMEINGVISKPGKGGAREVLIEPFVQPQPQPEQQLHTPNELY